MNDDDLFLRHALERLAGYPPDEDLAFAEVRRESMVIRRRRAAIGTTLCAGVFAVGIATITLRPSSGVSDVNLALNTSSTLIVDDASTVPAPPGPEVAPIPEASPVTSQYGQLIEPIAAPAPLQTQAPTIPPTLPEPPDTTARRPPRATQPRPTTPANPPGPAPATTTPPSPPTTAAPPPAPPTTQPAVATTAAPPSVVESTKTKEVTGGTVTVVWNGSKLRVAEAVPASGYSVTVEKASGSNVSVVFASESRTYRVRAKWSDERIVFEVQKETNSVPTTTAVPEDGAVEGGDENGLGQDGGRATHSGGGMDS